MSGWTLRRAEASDVAQLAAFARASFAETYAPTHDAVAITEHCRTVLADALFLQSLAEPGHRFLLAVDNERLLGFSQFKRAAPPFFWDSARPVEIKRFYVHRAAQGQGLAPALFEASAAEARRLDADAVWLGVYHHNQRAIRFYQRQGLSEIGVVPYTFGGVTEDDLAMGMRLESP